MAADNPTLVLIHGAFHTNLADDVTAIRQVILPLVDAGKEIILVAHSYGGTPGCAAVEGQTIAERSARGEKGGIKAIMFSSAILVPKRGISCGEAWGASGGETLHVEVKGPWGVANKKAKQVFYNDVPEELANEMMKETTSIQQGFGGFMSPVNFIPSDLKIPATYLLCEKDNCVPLSVQEGNVAAGMKTERIASGHSPMLSQPERTVEIIV